MKKKDKKDIIIIVLGIALFLTIIIAFFITSNKNHIINENEKVIGIRDITIKNMQEEVETARELIRENEELKENNSKLSKEVSRLGDIIERTSFDIINYDKTRVRYLTYGILTTIGGKVHISVYPKDDNGELVKTTGEIHVKLYTPDRASLLQEWKGKVNPSEYGFFGLEKDFLYYKDLTQYNGKTLFLEIILKTDDGSRFITHMDDIL